MLVLNEFLDKEMYDKLKAYSLCCEFGDVSSPVDGVVYPDICTDIPEDIKAHVFDKVSDVLGRDIADVMMFMRMSKAGTPATHIVHHEASHGKYSFMLYMNDNVLGGTGLVRHKPSGITYAAEEDMYTDLVVEDMNDVSKWHVYDKSIMVENAATIFDAGNLHCALPVGGFGEDQSEARMVLTVFFS